MNQPEILKKFKILYSLCILIIRHLKRSIYSDYCYHIREQYEHDDVTKWVLYT